MLDQCTSEINTPSE